jgi:F-type H+-transporting ATPase subunit gamma
MAKARAIDKRRKAVRNIRKITRTMQLIATSRFQKSLNRATASKPYTEKITELVEKISAAAADQVDHPLLRKNQGTGRAALLAITSNRGLCGGYNASLLRQVNAQFERNQQADQQTELHMVGKKGINYCRFLGRQIARAHTELGEWFPFAAIEPIADDFIRGYSRERFDALDVVYMKFLSAGRQEPTILRLIPVERESTHEGEPAPAERAPVQYDYSPAPAELMGELLPAAVKVQLFQCFMDALVSENIARMVAMKAATDAAGDMIKSLSQQYNRARQTQITMELLDIVGGAQAIE